jgi:hypothetical protein
MDPDPAPFSPCLLCSNFRELVQEHRKEVEGAVVSAEPLTDSQFNAIVGKMQKLTASGEKLLIKRQVDPDLIGGFVIRVGDRVQDLSVAAQIARMQKHLGTFFSSNPAVHDTQHRYSTPSIIVVVVVVPVFRCADRSLHASCSSMIDATAQAVDKVLKA